MSIKTIITEPNKILRQKSKDVISVGKDEQKLMDDMLDTMYAANGIGLAAIQIGILNTLCVCIHLYTHDFTNTICTSPAEVPSVYFLCKFLI